MHTVLMLEYALRTARGLGFRIREEALEGCEPGICNWNGKRWIFLDLDQTPAERLEIVAMALRGDARIAGMRLPRALDRYLDVRKSA